MKSKGLHFYLSVVFRTVLLVVCFTLSIGVNAQSGQKWSAGGNLSVSGDFLGTLNSEPLVIKTNSTEWLRITPGGLVGIGNPAPVYKLDVNGNFHLTGSGFIDSALTTANLIVLYDLNSLNIFTQDLTIKSLMGGGNKLLLADNAGQVSSFSFSGNTTDVLYGDGQWGSLPPPPQYDNWWQEDSGDIYTLNSGNVGIGNTDPDFKLDVTGDIKSSGSVWAENIYAAHSVNIGGFTFRNGAGGGIKDSISAENPVSISANQSIGLDADTVTIKNRVGIGKDSPEAALDVYGDVIASGSIYTDNLYAATSVNIGGFRFSKDTVSTGRDSISTPSPVSFAAAQSIEFLADTIYLQKMVGIGVLNPQAALDVNGDIRASGSIIGAGGLQMGGLTEFDSIHVIGPIKVGNTIKLEGGLPGEEENHIYSELTGPLVNDPTLYIQSKSMNYNTVINARNSGMVGIGTEEPLAKLHVVNRTPFGGSTSIRLDWNYEGQGIPNTVWDMKVSQGKMEFITPDLESPVIAMNVNGSVGIGVTPARNFHLKGITDGNMGPNPIDPIYTSTVIRIEDQVINSQNNRDIWWDIVVSGVQQKLYINKQESSEAISTNLMTLSEDGKIGLGTVNPLVKCHISDVTDYSLQSGGTAESTILRLEDAVIGSPNDRNVWWDIIVSGIQEKMIFKKQVSSDAEAVSILTLMENGNVGIQTTEPHAKLQVGTNITNLAIGDCYGEYMGWGTSYIGFNAARSSGVWRFETDGINNGGAIIYSNVDGNIIFTGVRSSGSGEMQTKPDIEIFDNRCMVITPDGTVLAKKVEVKPELWWDKVFNPSYDLMSIEEMEDYIRMNQHLPDIPTNEEVMKNGIELGKMNALLLKKVEELYLYIIYLNNKISELERKSKL